MREANGHGLNGVKISMQRLKSEQLDLRDTMARLVDEVKELRDEVGALRGVARDNGRVLDEVLRILRETE